ncbi:MAG: right-handed parallel beta-helix repeat-containing protein, partial [Planctomycetota bacterium]
CVRITDNVVIDPQGRGIGVKADASDVIISGNHVVGLKGKHATACIALFGSKLQRLGGRRIVSNNTLLATEKGAKAILVDGSNVDDTQRLEGPLITGNILHHDGLGILIKHTDRIEIIGNRIRGGWAGVHFAAMCGKNATLENNVITDFEKQDVLYR